jgi:hypothetical protein
LVDKSEKFRWLVRLGYAARGVVYTLVGYLALARPGGDDGPEGAFSWLHSVPLGEPLLYLTVLGLVGYGLHKFCSALFDIENNGSDRKGVAVRAGHAASAVAYLVLAHTAFRIARTGQEAGAGGGGQEVADTVLSVTFGSLVIGLVGLGFIVAAFMQGKSAVTGSFIRHLSGQTPRFVEYLGRAGLAARTVVFLLIAWSLMKSAWFSSSAEVKSLGEAVGSLANDRTLYTLVAIGLLLFGLFSLLVARYRIVPDLDRSDLKPALH